jgi:hypothetical protein
MAQLSLVSNANALTPQKSLLKSFISNFTSENFFSEIASLALFPADFGSNGSLMKSDSIIDYLRNFLKDIILTAQKYNFTNQVQIKRQSELINSILTVRESTPMIVSYDNIHQYITVPDLAAKKILKNALDNRINSLDIFKDELNTVINIINAYNEIKSISNNLLLYDYLIDSVDQNNQSVFESIKSYRDLVINSYNDLSKLQILNKLDKSTDYYVVKDEKTTRELSKSLVDYISDSYIFLKTGYELFDKFVDGFESASIHIVSAPSNHGKSIFLINLLRNIITYNIDEFEENDAIILLTLEDNIPKVVRRISSIFGNYKHNSIKDLYRESSHRIRENQKMSIDNQNLKDNIVNVFTSVLDSAIKVVTKFKVSLVIKYCSESTFSPGDLSKFVDQLRVTENLNTKMIVLDYIDVARPTIEGSKYGDDYVNQGQITHELRKLSVNLDIPILTATQNSRVSEDLNSEMSNKQVGDSYRKVRYTDYLYMSRMRGNKTFLDNDVAHHVIDKDPSSISPADLAAYESMCKVLIPYEVKITKAKEGVKDKSKYMLFCTENLRIYDKVDHYIQDRKQLIANTNDLEKKVSEMLVLNTGNDSSNFLNSVNF